MQTEAEARKVAEDIAAMEQTIKSINVQSSQCALLAECTHLPSQPPLSMQ